MNIHIIGRNGGLDRNIIKNLYSMTSNLIITSTNKKNEWLIKNISIFNWLTLLIYPALEASFNKFKLSLFSIIRS